MDRKQLEKVLASPMDRREFLKYLATLMVGLVGVAKLIELLKRPLSRGSGAKVQVDSGYGSSSYGK